MDINKLKSIILDTVIDVLSDLIVEEVQKRIKNRDNKILVVYSGATFGFEDSIKPLGKIIEEGYDVKVVLTESADRVLGADNIKKLLNLDQVYLDGKDTDIIKFIDESNILILPTLTINSAAKIANCISDTYLTRAASKFIMMGKKIYASKNSSYPNDKLKLPYAKKMIENMKTLESYGINFAEAKDLYGFFASELKEGGINKESMYYCDKNIITSADLINLEKGSTLCIKEKSILTELAKDQLRINSINIKFRS